MAKAAFKDAQAGFFVAVTDFPALVTPWALLIVCLAPAALMAEAFLSYLALLLCAAVSVCFLLLSHGRGWTMLSITCLLSVALGEGLGRYIRYKYVYPYHLYKLSAYHTNVLPSDRPDAYRDSGFLEFSADAYIDATQGLGYRAGSLWCVAPIVGAGHSHLQSLSTKPTGFWAVGRDCCLPRGLFECGEMDNPKARGGLVLLEDARTNLLATYTLAAQAAAYTYGLLLSEQPIFVEWSEGPTQALEAMFKDAERMVLLAIAIFFSIVPIFAFIIGCLGLALTTRDDGPHWHTDKVIAMRFGFDFTPRHYSRDIEADLLHMRCYMSGEVLYDYAFHVANKHMFLGFILCHPVHPYSKLERIIVLLIICLFLVFPVTAFSVKFGQSGITRTVMIMIFATIPRNILKLYLIRISEQDAMLVVDEGQVMDGDASRAAFAWEVTVLAVCLAAVGLTCLGCALYIRSVSTESLADLLGKNTDGLGFAFILEPLLDLFIPYIGVGRYEGTWAFGFFGRWRMERDAFAAGYKGATEEPEEGQVATNPSVPLFRSAGVEIFLGSGPRQRAKRAT